MMGAMLIAAAVLAAVGMVWQVIMMPKRRRAVLAALQSGPKHGRDIPLSLASGKYVVLHQMELDGEIISYPLSDGSRVYRLAPTEARPL